MPLRHEDTKKIFEKLSTREEEIGRLVVDAAFKVHSKLGPGLLEKIYEICFCYELKKSGLDARRQVPIAITYDNIILDEKLVLDVLVDDLVICELKAVDNVNPVWKAQIISHLHLSNKRLEYLINFNVAQIKDGINRFVL
ncbi:MAG: GxxExxY protein [Ignavibacteria bacterium]